MEGSIGKKNKGIAVVEILVAFAVFALGMTAVMLVVFGGQSFALDSKLTQRALYHAERGIEMAYASSTIDFQTLTAGTLLLNLSGDDDIYGDKVDLRVSNISECVKKVKSRVSWDQERRSRFAELASVFVSTSTSAALGGDCDTVALSGNWDNPGSFAGFDIGGPAATDIDVQDNFAYLTSSPNASNKSDFFILNVSDPENPVEMAVPPSKPLNTGNDQLFALDVAGGHAYAVGSVEDGQLQVIDVATDPANPSVIATSSLPGVDITGSYPEGRAVYFSADRLYVGTHETAGPEFHIFDVSVPATPTHLGSLELTHNIHEIKVLGDLAYLATSDNTGEFMAIDISNPGSMIHPDISGMKFDAPGNADGMSVEAFGGLAYLGRVQSSSDPDLYILNTTNPSSISVMGSKNLNMNPNDAAIEDMLVIGDYAFLLTTHSNKEFKIMDISDPNTIQPVSPCTEFNYPAKPTAMDREGDYIFTANESNDALRIIYDQPSACTS